MLLQALSRVKSGDSWPGQTDKRTNDQEASNPELHHLVIMGQMESRVYHGEIEPQDIADALIGNFHRGNFAVQQIGSGDQIVVQIATRRQLRSGGNTALSVTLQKIEDGVVAEVGRQSWFGIAASLGQTAIAALRSPFSLLGRLDDLAQDLESLQLQERVWEVITELADAMGASYELSERLRRLECAYCATANPVGASNCLACGAPLGEVHPQTCRHCGFVVGPEDTRCPNCNRALV